MIGLTQLQLFSTLFATSSPWPTTTAIRTFRIQVRGAVKELRRRGNSESVS
jgi:hypothetical protein